MGHPVFKPSGINIHDRPLTAWLFRAALDFSPALQPGAINRSRSPDIGLASGYLQKLISRYRASQWLLTEVDLQIEG
jgi:hypothetical protein